MGWRSLYSRFRAEPYYRRCERRLEGLENEATRLQARRNNRTATVDKIKGKIVICAWISTFLSAVYASWVYAQPGDTFTSLGRAGRVSLIIVVPLGLYILHTSIGWIVSLGDAWDKRRLSKIEAKRSHMLKDLKETAQFENIFAVIRKFDPEERKKADLLDKLKKEELVPRQWTPTTTIPSARQGFVASTTKGIVSGTGKMLMPVLDTLANSVIGDNPALVEEVKCLQRTVKEMQAANAALQMELSRLRSEDGSGAESSASINPVDFHEVKDVQGSEAASVDDDSEIMKDHGQDHKSSSAAERKQESEEEG